MRLKLLLLMMMMVLLLLLMTMMELLLVTLMITVLQYLTSSALYSECGDARPRMYTPPL
jgi:hypothetical protein